MHFGERRAEKLATVSQLNRENRIPQDCAYEHLQKILIPLTLCEFVAASAAVSAVGVVRLLLLLFAASSTLSSRRVSFACAIY